MTRDTLAATIADWTDDECDYAARAVLALRARIVAYDLMAQRESFDAQAKQRADDADAIEQRLKDVIRHKYGQFPDPRSS